VKSIPTEPSIVVFNGGPKDGTTIPYKFSMYPEYKAANNPCYSIGNYYTDSDPLPFEAIKWVRYELKKAVRHVIEPRKHVEINPEYAKDKYTVTIYHLHHADFAYVYQLEGSQDKPIVPEEAWFGRITEKELIDSFQNSNDDAYLAWIYEEEMRKQNETRISNDRVLDSNRTNRR
jgi:hypothetical protein